MAERLVKNNIELTVSVDGVSKEVYEHIRRGANFETLIRNLKSISDLKKKHKSNIVLNLNVAIMKSNYHQLEGFIDFAKEYGFEFICLMPIHIHLKTPEDIFTNQDIEALTYITEVSPEIEEKVKKYGIRLENRLPRLDEGAADKFTDEPKDNTKLLCHIPWQQLLIDYDGSVRPDCLCRIDRTAASLLEGFSLKDIWNNEVMIEYRKRIVNHDCNDFCNSLCFSGKISESHLKIP
jgi:MoaA/NifB/PqqE/SkfB family radical SAM enzyme